MEKLLIDSIKLNQKIDWDFQGGSDMCEVKEYVNYQNGKVLDLELLVSLKDNALLKVRPELWCEWNFEKNNELGFDIWEVTKGIRKKTWWYCSKCESDYDMETYNKVGSNQGCPYCSGKKVNNTNSLASLNPTLASQWHPSKNGKLTAHDVTYGSNEKVWWLGECGHEWDESVNNRNKNRNCPYCSNHRVMKGFNDMWTTNPEIASMLTNPEDGYKYTQNSNQRVEWKCRYCGARVGLKTISSIKKLENTCVNCNDGKSYAEKVMYHFLKLNNIYFNSEQTFKWSDRKRYDFYIPSLNLIIEMHGEQHYIQTGRKGARTLEEEQCNDRYKYDMAISNCIKPEDYIIIDCRKSDFNFIKNNILNSRLNELFNLSEFDWMGVLTASNSSLVNITLDLWNKGFTISEIEQATRLSSATISKYLKKATKNKICNYKAGDGNTRATAKRTKKIVRLTTNNEFIDMWQSAQQISEILKISGKSVGSVCRKEYISAFGYKWMYEEDYKNYIEQKENTQ